MENFEQLKTFLFKANEANGVVKIKTCSKTERNSLRLPKLELQTSANASNEPFTEFNDYFSA